MQQTFMARGYDDATAHQAALASISGLVNTQATVMSFNDAFLFIGFTVWLVFPPRTGS